jgi:hypothetical protein
MAKMTRSGRLGRFLYWFFSGVVVLLALRWIPWGVAEAIPSVAYHMTDRATALYLHMVPSAIPMALIPFQLSTRFRLRHPRAHRIMGWAAIGGTMVGGLALLPLAMHIDIEPWGRAGFVIAGLIWFGSATMGLIHILRRDIARHRWWMMITATVIFGAVTQRLALPVFIVAGFDFKTAYSLTPYTAFTLNLALFFAWQYRQRLRGNVGARSRA